MVENAYFLAKMMKNRCRYSRKRATFCRNFANRRCRASGACRAVTRWRTAPAPSAPRSRRTSASERKLAWRLPMAFCVIPANPNNNGVLICRCQQFSANVRGLPSESCRLYFRNSARICGTHRYSRLHSKDTLVKIVN